MKKLGWITWLVVAAIMISSCTTYRSGFDCPEGQGARCVMLSRIDNMVDSGEIETIGAGKKCQNGKCKEGVKTLRKKLIPAQRVKLEPRSREVDEYWEGEYLHLK